MPVNILERFINFAERLKYLLILTSPNTLKCKKKTFDNNFMKLNPSFPSTEFTLPVSLQNLILF